MKGDKTDIIDVQEFIDSRSMSAFQRGLLAICFFIVFADGFDTSAIGFVAPALVREWGIAKPALGPVLSAAIIGMAVGALVAGPAADRFGRKRILFGSVVAFSAVSILSAAASSIDTLTTLRFIAGLGLGATMPNTATLLSEYVPSSKRGFLVNVMYCGFTLGAASGGIVAAALLPYFGWRSVFMVGGALPMALAIALLWVPDSISYMVAKGERSEKVRAILERIGGEIPLAGSRFVLGEKQAAPGRFPLATILSSRFRFGSLMLWTTYFMGLLVYYLLSSWMPTLIRESGMGLSEAALITALLPLGATAGTIACGFLMDRGNPRRVVAVAYLLAAGFIWATGKTLGIVPVLVMMLFSAGLFLGAAQGSMPVLAAPYYATSARASGVAWMVGIGRIGGILGALTGGVLMQMGLSLSSVLCLIAIPGVVAAVALVGLDMVTYRRTLLDVRAEATP